MRQRLVFIVLPIAFIGFCIAGMAFVSWRWIQVIEADGWLSAILIRTPAARSAWLYQILFFLAGLVCAVPLTLVLGFRRLAEKGKQEASGNGPAA